MTVSVLPHALCFQLQTEASDHNSLTCCQKVESRAGPVPHTLGEQKTETKTELFADFDFDCKLLQTEQSSISSVYFHVQEL